MSGKTESELLERARAAGEAAIMAAAAANLVYAKLSHNRFFDRRSGEAAAIRELNKREQIMSIAAGEFAAAGECESDCTICGGESGENCRQANYFLLADSECEARAAIMMIERAAGDAISSQWDIWRAIRIANCDCSHRRNCPIAAMAKMGERARIAAIDLLRALHAIGGDDHNHDHERRRAMAGENSRAAAAMGELLASMAGECKAGELIL